MVYSTNNQNNSKFSMINKQCKDAIQIMQQTAWLDSGNTLLIYE